jgi:hypothetical protein
VSGEIEILTASIYFVATSPTFGGHQLLTANIVTDNFENNV